MIPSNYYARVLTFAPAFCVLWLATLGSLPAAAVLRTHLSARGCRERCTSPPHGTGALVSSKPRKILRCEKLARGASIQALLRLVDQVLEELWQPGQADTPASELCEHGALGGTQAQKLAPDPMPMSEKSSLGKHPWEKGHGA